MITINILCITGSLQQVVQLLQSDRAAWWISLAESERRYSVDNIGLSSTTVT